MTRVACIGECMIELKQADGGLFSRGYGGDTLNTSVYLARLGVERRLHHRAWRRFPQRRDDRGLGGGGRWHQAGAAAARQIARHLHDRDRCEGRAPVLPLARKFRRAPPDGCARDGRHPEFAASYDLVYLSAITLSLYNEEGRGRLFAALAARARSRDARGVRHQFSRPRLARSGYRARRLSRRLCGTPISCSPRPRICCRCLPEKATMV